MPRPFSVAMRKLIRRVRPEKKVDLAEVHDINGRKGRKQAIPRMVYSTAESRWVHPTHFKSISQFREINDDLDFVIFDREARDEYMENRWASHPIFDVYRRSLFGQMKADIFRYCVVFDNGGYYVDFNKGIDARITGFHPADATGLVSYETNPELVFPDEEVARQLHNPFNLVMQWAFGFAPGHRFLEMVIDRIVEIEPYFRGRSFKFPKSALLTISGPGVFSQVFREYVKKNGVSGIVEAGEDFHAKGLFRLRGSKLLSKESVGYDKWRNMEIVSARPVATEPNESESSA